MSRVIYKYEVPVDDQWHDITTPGPARVIHVGWQGALGTVYLWAEVDIEGHGDVKRRMRAFGTGQAIPEGAVYVGTTLAGPFVWHVYAEPADGRMTSGPAVESVRARPPHPVHIPEHLRGVVTEGQNPRG